MISLRPYQAEIVESVKQSFMAGKRSPIIVSPSGSGKTVMFSFFAAGAVAKGNRILLLSHRDELIDQISRTLMEFQVEHSFVAAGREYSSKSKVHVGSVMSVVRRLNQLSAPDLIIVDECHHAVSSSWRKIFDFFQRAYRVGATATPERLSGEPLNDVFDDIILGPTVKALIDIGSLSPYRIYAPASISTEGIHIQAGDFSRGELAALVDKPTITGNAIVEYNRLSRGKRAVVFCVSVEHARHVAEEFSAAGHFAKCLEGGMAREIRRQCVKEFRDGHIKVLTSCDLISEGFDVPAIEVAILLRPTQSLAIWLQQAGRALRPFPGKETAIILDHSGNCLRHGLPDENREWTLDGKEKKKKRTPDDSGSVKICPKCFGAQSSGRTTCLFCGLVFEVKPRKINEVDGLLLEVDSEIFRIKSRREQGTSRSLEALVALGKKRGYKNPYGWAYFVLRSRNAKKQVCQ